MIHDGGARRECDAELRGRVVFVHWGVAGWYELAITTGRLKGAALRIWRMRRNDLTHFRRALGYTRDEQPPWSFASVTPEQLAARMAAREDDPIVESYPFEHTEGEDQ